MIDFGLYPGCPCGDTMRTIRMARFVAWLGPALYPTSALVCVWDSRQSPPRAVVVPAGNLRVSSESSDLPELPGWAQMRERVR